MRYLTISENEMINLFCKTCGQQDSLNDEGICSECEGSSRGGWYPISGMSDADFAKVEKHIEEVKKREVKK